MRYRIWNVEIKSWKYSGESFAYIIKAKTLDEASKKAMVLLKSQGSIGNSYYVHRVELNGEVDN